MLKEFFFTASNHHALPNNIHADTNSNAFLFNLFHPENFLLTHQTYQDLPNNPTVMQLFKSISPYIQSSDSNSHINALSYITAFMTHYKVNIEVS